MSPIEVSRRLFSFCKSDRTFDCTAIATRQASKNAPKESAGVQHLKIGRQSFPRTSLGSGRGTAMLALSLSVNPAGVFGRGALRKIFSIIVSFIYLRGSQFGFGSVGAQRGQRLAEAILHRARGDVQHFRRLLE